MLSASVCEFTETSVLDWRRDAETLQSAVDELKRSTLTITQRVQQIVAAVCVLNESSELLELRSDVREAVLHSCVAKQQCCMEMTAKGPSSTRSIFYSTTSQHRDGIWLLRPYSVHVVSGMILCDVVHYE